MFACVCEYEKESVVTTRVKQQQGHVDRKVVLIAAHPLRGGHEGRIDGEWLRLPWLRQIVNRRGDDLRFFTATGEDEDEEGERGGAWAA